MTDIKVYAQRRATLLATMQHGIAIVPTAPERVRNRDSEYLYRFDSYFYYLSGFHEPEAVLVLVAGAEPQSLLFCREKNLERETWDGFRYGPEAAREPSVSMPPTPSASSTKNCPRSSPTSRRSITRRAWTRTGTRASCVG
jgi:Xaa-Pro aminopeptidase